MISLTNRGCSLKSFRLYTGFNDFHHSTCAPVGASLKAPSGSLSAVLTVLRWGLAASSPLPFR